MTEKSVIEKSTVSLREGGEAFELALMAAEKDLGVETSAELRKLAGSLFAKWLEMSGVAPEGRLEVALLTALWRSAGMLARKEVP